MEKNVSSVAEQDKTAEVKKNPKLIELARPYKFDDKEYTEIDLSGLDDLTIKDAVLIIKKLYNEGEMAVMITPETATAYTDALAAAATKLPIEFFQLAQARRFARLFRRRSVASPQRKMATRTSTATS